MREALRELVDELGETCNIGVLEGLDYVYIDRIESKWPLRIHLEVGYRAAVNCIAGGKVLLAYLEPRAAWSACCGAASWSARTPRSITSVSELEAELEKVRARGYGTNNEENFEGIVAVAVPILDTRGRVVAALTMHGPLPRMTMERLRGGPAPPARRERSASPPPGEWSDVHSQAQQARPHCFLISIADLIGWDFPAGDPILRPSPFA